MDKNRNGSIFEGLESIYEKNILNYKKIYIYHINLQSKKMGTIHIFRTSSFNIFSIISKKIDFYLQHQNIPYFFPLIFFPIII